MDEAELPLGVFALVGRDHFGKRIGQPTASLTTRTVRAAGAEHVPAAAAHGGGGGHERTSLTFQSHR
jgi:hypothetical protein